MNLAWICGRTCRSESTRLMGGGYDAILLGYALCGRGTEGLRAGKTQLVLPRLHDCIGLLMGSHQAYMAYFEGHPGVYYRSPG